MAVVYNTGIVTRGLRHVTDSQNRKSYSGSGSTITDIVTKGSGTDSIPNANVSWMNAGVSAITLTSIFKRSASDPAYSTVPFAKYALTTDNTFRMYVFGNFAGAAPADDGRITFYAYVGGAWNSVGGVYVASVNQTVMASLQYNSSTGGQLWINGAKVGSRSASGTLGSATNTSALTVYTPPVTSTVTQYYTSIYDRELSDSEMMQNYSALKGRFGI